jgi:RNA polymerase sigma factor (sigma-70 family)
VPSTDPIPSPRPNHFGEAFPDLLGAAQADAGWAYERLFRAFAPAVLGYLRTLGVEDPDAATNEVFLRAFTNIGRFQGDETGFRSWVFTIAHNAALDDRRRRSRRPAIAEGEVPDDVVAAAEETALEHVDTDEVLELLDDLSPDQRDVLVLRLVADLTVEQVAGVLGKRVGAVKALQRRGLAALRRRAGLPPTVDR